MRFGDADDEDKATTSISGPAEAIILKLTDKPPRKRKHKRKRKNQEDSGDSRKAARTDTAAKATVKPSIVQELSKGPGAKPLVAVTKTTSIDDVLKGRKMDLSSLGNRKRK